ncbi:MAG: acylneuraminate cytidylyltransferase family protein [Parcubacteria group bacterium]|nr:acylneuraminate cytidylyltransferase family protein [Parcubacteria group bacterium]
MSTLAVITARSGSRGLPDKNIKPLLGKPLIAYAVNPALEAETVDRVIVDTDSEKYAEIARGLGAETPYLRPAALAEDVPSEKVLIHALQWLQDHEGYRPQVVVTLQPTTPGILPTEIDRLVRAVTPLHLFDSAATVCEASEHPEWMFTLREDGTLTQLHGKTRLKGNWGVRQTLLKTYRLTGAGYASTRRLLLDEQRIIGNRCFAVTIPKERSVDIDDAADFAEAEYMLSRVNHP